MNIFSWGQKENKPFKLERTPVTDYCEQAIKKGHIGIIFGGGGSFGAVEIGVVAYLEQIGLLHYVDLYVGTSVGGLNCMLVSKYQDKIDTVLDTWSNIKENKDIYDGKVPTNIGDAVARGISYAFGDKAGVVKPKGLYKILETHFNGMSMEDFPTPVRVTATNVGRKERFVFSSKDTPGYPAVVAGKATSAIPVLFPHVNFYDMVLCDGGIANNNPVEVAIESGCDKIILIGCTPDTMDFDIPNDLIEDGIHSLSTALHLAEEDNWDIVESGKYPLLDIYPDNMKRMPKNILDFSTTRQTIQYGYDLAASKLPQDKVINFLQK